MQVYVDKINAIIGAKNEDLRSSPSFRSPWDFMALPDRIIITTDILTGDGLGYRCLSIDCDQEAISALSADQQSQKADDDFMSAAASLLA